jgi:hypothetical protein
LALQGVNKGIQHFTHFIAPAASAGQMAVVLAFEESAKKSGVLSIYGRGQIKLQFGCLDIQDSEGHVASRYISSGPAYLQ